MSLSKKMAASAAALMIFAAPAAYAQGALVGTEALDDRIDDIQENVEEDFEDAEDPARFGTQRYSQGWTGSLSAGGTLTSGNTDNLDLSVGARVRNSTGPWHQTLGFAFEYAEDDDERNKNEVFMVYDLNRDFTPRVYGFALGSATYDEFDSIEKEAFLGFGPGYRIVNTPDMAWRVQAGPGVRYLEDQDGEDETEVAGIASSRFYVSLSESAFFTNDTDVLHSDTNTRVVNDAGVNMRLTDVLSTRVSLKTDYNSDPLDGYDNTDNTLGASLIYTFR